jgi:hypothetical protein
MKGGADRNGPSSLFRDREQVKSLKNEGVSKGNNKMALYGRYKRLGVNLHYDQGQCTTLTAELSAIQ